MEVFITDFAEIVYQRIRIHGRQAVNGFLYCWVKNLSSVAFVFYSLYKEGFFRQ